MNPVIPILAEALAVPADSLREPRPGELAVDVEAGALPAVADRLVAGLGARLASLFATDERALHAAFALHQIWLLSRHRTFVRVSARVDPAHPRFPSIAARHPGANWFEREVMDTFGLVPEGHPNPTPRVPARRLARGRVDAAQGLRRRPLRATRRGRPPPVPAGDGRRCLPGAGGPRARRHHRARALPLRSGRRACPLPAAPPLLRAQGDGEAVRAAALAPRPVPRRVRLRRHGCRPRPRLGPRDRAARRLRAAASRAPPPRRPARARAPVQPRRGHRRHRHRRGLRRPRRARPAPARGPRLALRAALRVAAPPRDGGPRRGEGGPVDRGLRGAAGAPPSLPGRLRVSLHPADRRGQLHRPGGRDRGPHAGGRARSRRRRPRRPGLRDRRGPAPRPPARRLRFVALRGPGGRGRGRPRPADGAGERGGPVSRDPPAGARCAPRLAARRAPALGPALRSPRPWAGPRGGAGPACTGWRRTRVAVSPASR